MGQAPEGVSEGQPHSVVSLPLSLPLSLKINKQNLKKKCLLLWVCLGIKYKKAPVAQNVFRHKICNIPEILKIQNIPQTETLGQYYLNFKVFLYYDWMFSFRSLVFFYSILSFDVNKYNTSPNNIGLYLFFRLLLGAWINNGAMFLFSPKKKKSSF